jgi:hypothetical protein
MVREAGIDGTVTVQVLVGKDGKVKQAQAIDGPEPRPRVWHPPGPPFSSPRFRARARSKCGLIPNLPALQIGTPPSPTRGAAAPDGFPLRYHPGPCLSAVADP